MLLEMYIKGFLLEVMNSSDASEISVIGEKLDKASKDLKIYLESFILDKLYEFIFGKY